MGYGVGSIRLVDRCIEKYYLGRLMTGDDIVDLLGGGRLEGGWWEKKSAGWSSE